MSKLFDVAAHNPDTGELLKMYRGVPEDTATQYKRLLADECPGAEITDREHEPEDADPLDVPEFMKRDKPV